jgi:hypothetical protein
MDTVALLNIEPLRSTVFEGESKEGSINVGSFPHRKNPMRFNN